MKKLLIFLLVAVIFSFSSNINNSFAQNAPAASVSSTRITLQDLGVENPGILPTSPFYFFKDISRGVQRFFTFNPVKKAELELNIANQQAAEIKKIQEISPKNIDAIAKASENYQENIERLKARLETIKETSQNPNVDKLVENLVDKSVRHQQLFEELKKDFQEKEELKSLLNKNQEIISEAVVKVPEKFENPKEFKERLKNIIEKQDQDVDNQDNLKELKAIGIINKIEDKMTEEDRDEMESIKDDFIEKFEKRFEKNNESEKEKILNQEFLDSLSGDKTSRLKIFKDIKGRFQDPEIESHFQDLEDLEELNGDLNEPENSEIEDLFQDLED